MVFCLGAQVFFRFVLNASLTRFAFIWLVYMGAVLGAKERIHIRVAAFHRLLPAAARGGCCPGPILPWVALNLTFAWQGALQVGHLMRFSYISPALQWNMALVYSVVPVGFLLMSFRILEGDWRDWRHGTLGQPVEEAAFASESVGNRAAPNMAPARRFFQDRTDPPQGAARPVAASSSGTTDLPHRSTRRECRPGGDYPRIQSSILRFSMRS